MKAVILARGLGTRMQREDASAELTPAQAEAAALGMKAMMPVHRGRPFLDWVLSALADGGVNEVCLVVGPEAVLVQRHYHHELTLRRLRIAFAVQVQPRGTADAVLAAERFVKSDRFLVLNADNYYPVTAYRALRELDGAGMAGFDRDVLVREGNVDADRIRRYALLQTDADGFLQRIVEKPDQAAFDELGAHALVSMNLWAFTPSILEACRQVQPSARGELELPDAVALAITVLGMRVRVVPVAAPVLDLASRADVATVTAALRDIPVRL